MTFLFLFADTDGEGCKCCCIYAASPFVSRGQITLPRLARGPRPKLRAHAMPRRKTLNVPRCVRDGRERRENTWVQRKGGMDTGARSAAFQVGDGEIRAAFDEAGERRAGKINAGQVGQACAGTFPAWTATLGTHYRFHFSAFTYLGCFPSSQRRKITLLRSSICCQSQ